MYMVCALAVDENSNLACSKKVFEVKNLYFGVKVKRNDSGPRTDRLFL